MGMNFWQPRKRPDHDQVPAHVRKIWLARDCFAEHAAVPQARATQEVLYAGDEVLALRGRSRLRTQPRAGFDALGQGGQVVQIHLWVPFRLHFSEIPTVSLALAEKRSCDLRATRISCDGFQIMLQQHDDPSEPDLEVIWKAAGFREAAASLGAAG